MKEKYILNPISNRLLHIGMCICIAAYFFVLLDIYYTLSQGVIILNNVYTMLEHVSMSMLLFVAAALLFDVHIKSKK